MDAQVVAVSLAELFDQGVGGHGLGEHGVVVADGVVVFFDRGGRGAVGQGDDVVAALVAGGIVDSTQQLVRNPAGTMVVIPLLRRMKSRLVRRRMTRRGCSADG